MKYTLLYIMVVAVCVLTSCTKGFLEVNNTQQLFRETYVKDLASMQEYLRGAYYNYSSNFKTGQTQVVYPEIAADNVRPLSLTSAPATAAHYNWTQEAVPSAIRNMTGEWTTGYLVIRMCSFVIDNVDKYRSENPARADNMKGEALTLRALVFSQLVNVFAQPYGYTVDASHPGIPYITTSDITQPYTRQSVAEVYASMIGDLNNAIPLLPVTATDNRFLSRVAGKALLARVYLFKGDYAQAKALAIEVANQVPLMTSAAGYPNDMFKLKAPAVTECLFQTTPGSSNVLGRWFRRSPITHGATADIATILLEYSADARKVWVKDTLIAGNNLWLVKKFPTGVTPEDPGITTPDIAYYQPILRSSEMFLTAAEAAAKTNDEVAARTYLNAIRKRANPSIADVNATGPALIDSIYKERRKELAFEGFRMFDLLRCKMGVNRIDVLPGSPATLTYPNDKAIAPLPMDEPRLAGLAQNPGY